jgi:hypothetical protein
MLEMYNSDLAHAVSQTGGDHDCCQPHRRQLATELPLIRQAFRLEYITLARMMIGAVVARLRRVKPASEDKYD